jgi:hypothetical protein
LWLSGLEPLIVERFLIVERIENFDGRHDTCRRKSEHGVEQVDQQVSVRFGAEQTPFSYVVRAAKLCYREIIFVESKEWSFV